jgi:HSP20 family protein
MTNLIRRNQYDRNFASRAHDAAQTWDPFRVMDALLRWEPARDQAASASVSAFAPAFEVKEIKGAYVIKADLPGVSEADLDVTVTANAVSISGKREPEQDGSGERYYALERGYGAFSRTFSMPDGADLEELSASLKNGVLTVHVPKRPEVQPRKITIGKGEANKGSA